MRAWTGHHLRIPQRNGMRSGSAGATMGPAWPWQHLSRRSPPARGGGRYRGLSSPGRASAWHAEGSEFDPRRLHRNGGVRGAGAVLHPADSSQLGTRRDAHRRPAGQAPLHHAHRARQVERRFEMPKVTGSIPVVGTQEWGARRSPCEEGPAAGSVPKTTKPGHVCPSLLQHMVLWSCRQSSPGSQPGDRRFEPDQDYAPRRHSRPHSNRGQCGFDSHSGHQAAVAHLAERGPGTTEAAGSSPAGGSHADVAQW